MSPPLDTQTQPECHTNRKSTFLKLVMSFLRSYCLKQHALLILQADVTLSISESVEIHN